MNQSIATTYATRMETTNSVPQVWKWPQKRKLNAVQPDPRLIDGIIPGLRAELELGNGVTVAADVRAVSQHDLVLVTRSQASVPVNGQVVSVSLCRNGQDVLTKQKSIVHWSGRVFSDSVVALFTIEPMGVCVERWTSTQERGEVRFPIDTSVVLHTGNETQANGRIIDYSLSGCRLHCVDKVELGVEYKTTVMFPQSTINVSVTPRWVLNSEGGFQMGCSFKPEQGVLMACRHHPQPTGLCSPPKLQSANWNGRQS